MTLAVLDARQGPLALISFGENTSLAAQKAMIATDAAELSQAWATGTLPGGAGTKSSREWSLEAQLLLDGAAFAVAYGDLTALAQTSLLDGLTGAVDGNLARVVNSRDGGWWKFHSGDLSAQVAADPLGGLWRAPTAAPTGASGAWERMVEKSEFDAEWWFPESSLANAQVNLNAAIAAITDPYARLLLPRRPLAITDEIVFSKGFEYIGAGVDNPIDGGGSAFYCIRVNKSNAKLRNISAGNVSGTLASGEPGGFRVESYREENLIDFVRTENVSVRDCHAFEATQGLRVSATNVFDNGDPETGEVINVPAKDTYIENFRCEEIGRIGIECFRAHGVQIVGGHVRLADTYAPGGLRRGIRMVGADAVTVQGGRYRGMLSVEVSGVLDDLKGCNDITMEGVTCEEFGSFFVQELCRNITINGCKGLGYDDSNRAFIDIQGSMDVGKTTRNIKLIGNQSVNQATFIQFKGRIAGLEAIGNTFISNNAADTKFFISSGNPANEELIEGKFVGNTGIGNGPSSGGMFRYANTTAATTLTIDDNKFTPDAAGVTISVGGSGTLRQKSVDSNEKLSSSLWATMRPPFAAEEYP